MTEVCGARGLRGRRGSERCGRVTGTRAERNPHDTRDRLKQAIVQQLIVATRPLALPWRQVGCEFLAARFARFWAQRQKQPIG